MSPELILVLLSVVFLIFLMVLGVPISFSLAIAGLSGYAYLEGWNVAAYQLSIVTWSHALSYTFACFPLFILTGEFAYQGGFASDFYNGVQKWLSRLPGGLLVTAFISCAGFAAVTGSSSATVASIGSMSYPELKKNGYNSGVSLAGLAAGGTLGILIPPSLAMVFYAIVTEQSIGKLFIAGIFPGILLASLFCALTLLIALIKPSLLPRGENALWGTRFKVLPKMIVIPLVFVIIIGGIYTGIYTPTESAGVATVFILFCSLVFGRFRWKGFVDSLFRAGRLTAMILMIIVGGILYAHFLVRTDAVTQIIEFISGLGLSRGLFLIVLIPFYTILGMFLDVFGMMIVTLPILFPIIIKMGVDPIFFGIFITVMCEMALITPPVGVNTYIAISLGGPEVKMGGVFVWIFPYYLVMLLFAFILIAFPIIALWLPGISS